MVDQDDKVQEASANNEKQSITPNTKNTIAITTSSNNNDTTNEDDDILLAKGMAASSATPATHNPTLNTTVSSPLYAPALYVGHAPRARVSPELSVQELLLARSLAQEWSKRDR